MLYNKIKEELKMSIFNFWKKDVKDEVAPLSSPSDLSAQVDDPLLKALLCGEAITRDKAMMIPAVSSAVDFIASSVACMPVKLLKRKNGRVEIVDKDTRVRLLNGDTGDTLNAYQMKKAMVEDYLLDKGGYAYVRRDRNDVTGLFYVEPVYISYYKNIDPIYKKIQFQIMTNRYWDWEIIRLLRNTKDGAIGRGLTDEISKALQTAYATMLFQLRQVQRGGAKKGFVMSEKNLTQEALDKLKAAWRRMFEGDNTENVMILNNGLKFQESSATSVEMQLDQTKKSLCEEIASVFHIHEDFDQTYKEAIYPVVKSFEAALNNSLLLENEKKKGYFFEFDVKEIIKASLKERFEAYEKAKKTGFMTLNEIREWESMNPVEGLDVIALSLGDVLFDTEKHTYYTPNMAVTTDLRGNVDVAERNEGGVTEKEETTTAEPAEESVKEETKGEKEK